MTRNSPRILLLIVSALAVFGLSAPAISAEKMPIKVLAVIAGDEEIGRLKNPTGLFFDEAKKRLYITDSGNKRLISFDNEFKYIAELSHEAMVLPASIVRNKEDNFIFVDASRQEVMFVEVKKESIRPFEFLGVPQAGEPFYPGRIAINRATGVLYVIDRLNKRIISAGQNGKFIRAMTVSDKGFFGFNDIKVDEADNVYAIDSVGGVLYVFDGAGGPVSRIPVASSGVRFPGSLAVDKNGLIYVTDMQGDMIFVFNRAGALQHTLSRPGVKEGELEHPSYIYIDSEGRIFIIDGDRIQVFSESKG